jgi:hypothetical protein
MGFVSLTGPVVRIHNNASIINERESEFSGSVNKLNFYQGVDE